VECWSASEPPSACTEYDYDAADQLVQADAASYSYDENGNQVERASDTFQWDHENRLVATDLNSVESSYTYNGDGLRVSRTVGGNTVDYVWDVGSSLPAVLQDSDGNTYVYGLDLISRTDGEDNQEYYLSDGLGSTTGLTDDSGDVLDEYQYDVFGAIRDHTGDSPNEFTFTGEQNDGTGLEYLRARYYDPSTGRFLGRDPIPYLQRYAYAGSNPANLTDPTGLTPSVPAAMAAAAVCVARNAPKMLDINDGNPCAQELADLNASVEAMLEATWEGLRNGWDDVGAAIGSFVPDPVEDFVTGTVPQWIYDHRYDIGQVVTGAVISVSCFGAMVVCVPALIAYGTITGLKVWEADGRCERVFAATSGVLGGIPGNYPFGRFTGEVFAGLSGSIDAFGCASPAYAAGRGS
jgi:RHS repeat-associated protein